MQDNVGISLLDKKKKELITSSTYCMQQNAVHCWPVDLPTDLIASIFFHWNNPFINAFPACLGTQARLYNLLELGRL